MVTTTISTRAAVLAALLLSVALTGCVEQGSPELRLSLASETVAWGGAAQVTLRNVGDAHLPAPVPLEVRSSNGTLVRAFEDVTGGRGIAVNGQVSVSWSGLNAEGEPVLWGAYTLAVPGTQQQARFVLERPPHYAITIDPIPREVPAGQGIEFRVNNTGTTWVNGTMSVLGGRDALVVYQAEAEVTLAPGTGRSFFWGGRMPDGSLPEAQKYLVAAAVEPDEGPRPFAQDVFEVLEP